MGPAIAEKNGIFRRELAKAHGHLEASVTQEPAPRGKRSENAGSVQGRGGPQSQITGAIEEKPERTCGLFIICED